MEGLLTLVVLLCVFSNFKVLTVEVLDGRKNVLVFIGDDVGFETQIYNNTVCKTPHINKLAKRSVIFKNAFTSVSSCSPSRSAILTGELWY